MKCYLTSLTILFSMVFGGLDAFAGSSAVDPVKASSQFAEANSLFDQANAKALKNPAQAQSFYQSAILKYQRLVDTGLVDSAELYSNLGNAYFFSGDHGRAVLNYQRALMIDPLQDDVRHNLDYARSLTVDELPQSSTQQITHALTFWHRWPFAARATLFGVAHAGMWVMLALLFYRRLRWHFASISIAFGISLVFGCSLLVSQQAWDNPVDGVVLDHEVIARQGNGYIYDSAFTSSLHAGTEFTLIDQRGEWYHAKLLDGTTCWLPKKSVAMTVSVMDFSPKN